MEAAKQPAFPAAARANQIRLATLIHERTRKVIPLLGDKTKSLGPMAGQVKPNVQSLRYSTRLAGMGIEADPKDAASILRQIMESIPVEDPPAIKVEPSEEADERGLFFVTMTW